jgi:hypothetical protein
MQKKLAFRSHVFAAAIERDLVLFDSAADRYVAVPGGLCDHGGGGIDVGLASALLVEGAGEMLIGAQLLSADICAAAVPTVSKPSRMLAASPATRARPTDIARFVRSIVQTRQRMKSGLPCGSFRPTRCHRPIIMMSRLKEAVSRLQSVRLLAPHPRRCLPASTVAALFLRSLGHEVEIVFGVRSHPFEAHCWIETDGIVLDDDLDRVRAFTPIAVGQL